MQIIAMLEILLTFKSDFKIETVLLLISLRVPSGFHFLPHGLGGGGRSWVYSQYKNYVFQASSWSERRHAFSDYHQLELYFMSDADLSAIYAPLTLEWEQNLLCSWKGFMHFRHSLYLIGILLHGKVPYANLARRIALI